MAVHAHSHAPSGSKVEWSEAPGADSYRVRRYKYPNQDHERAFDHPKERRDFSDADLEFDSWYTYVVEAMDRDKNIIAEGRASARTEPGDQAKKAAIGR